MSLLSASAEIKMTKDEALLRAIIALENPNSGLVPHNDEWLSLQSIAIKACEEALEQPTQEPMIVKQDNGMVLKLGYEDLPNGTAFYTTPPSREWQSLSDDEINLIYPCTGGEHDFKDIARAIEDKLKEKNT